MRGTCVLLRPYRMEDAETLFAVVVRRPDGVLGDTLILVKTF